MKYNVGDRVRIKSLDWYNKSERNGNVYLIGWFNFIKPMADFCGKIVTIKEVQSPYNYRIFEDGGIHYYTDEMIEGLVEEDEEIEFTEKDKYWCDLMGEDDPTIFNLPDGYIFKDENGNVINARKIVLEKKKKEYPKTYEECCKVLGWNHRDYDRVGYKSDLLCKLQVLLLCRDAYWKIAGEEMGLGKPWEPDCTSGYFIPAIIYRSGSIQKVEVQYRNAILIFPTEEMRDAFYENFKEEIEKCKELL